MPKEYEIAVLLHPDLEIDLDAPLKKIDDIFKKEGGKVLSADNWGKRKIAYPIAKQHFAIYMFYRVELGPDKVAAVENSLRISDEVLRFQTVRAEDIPEKPKKEKDDEEDNDEKKSDKDDSKESKE